MMSNLNQDSREELKSRIEELQILLAAMKAEKDNEELLNFPWIGNLGNWYWSIGSNTVVCNDQKILALGYVKEEIPESIGFEFFTNKLHPDDHERVMDNMRAHLYGKTAVYETIYRIQTKEGNWKWFYDRGKVTKRNAEGNPELVAGIVFDVTEQKHMEQLLAEQNQQLLELSRIDPLTKLFNRRALYEKLESEKDRTDRYGKTFSILMIDLDHFKTINDTHGHLVGDRVLAQVTDTITKMIRKTDTVGRYGGEEFIIVLPETSKPCGNLVAEKVRRKIKNATFDEGLRVTVSIGVVEYKLGQTIDELVESADALLYVAKKNGRNRVESAPD